MESGEWRVESAEIEGNACVDIRHLPKEVCKVKLLKKEFLHL